MFFICFLPFRRGSKDIFLASKYGVLDDNKLRLYEYGTLKYTLSDPQMEIIKEGENYTCEFTGNMNGMRHAISFSLDEINVDRSLLKQFELESQIQKISRAAEVISVDAVARKLSSDIVHSGRLAKAILENSNQDQNLQADIAHYFSQLVKREVDLQRLVKGEKGPAGPQGPVGPRGLQGPPGSGATASQVANELVNQKATDLGKAVIDADSSSQHPLSSKIVYWLKDLLRKDQEFKNDVKGETGPQGQIGLQGIKGDPGPPGKKGDKGDKGQDGAAGVQGPPGQNGIAGATAGEVAGVLLNQRATELGKAIIDADLLNPQYPLSSKMAYWARDLLMRDQEFKNDVKGPAGPQGPVGPPGKEGSAGAGAMQVADVLVNQKAHDLGKAVLGVKVGGRGSDKDKSKLSLELATNSDLQQGVANKLKTDPGKARGPQGIQGEKGAVGPIGLQGSEGKQGPIGLQGPEGKQGPIGLQGPEGKQGQKGEKGDKGDKGQGGAQGLEGPQGPKGDQGDPGKDGSEGPQGERGADGATGPRGRDGGKGERGDDGPEGPRGEDGKQGKGANPAKVAEKLISNKTDELVNIIRQEVVDRVTTWGASKRLVDSLTYDDILRIIEGKADTGRHKLFERLLSNADLQDPSKAKTFIGNEVAGNAGLHNAVADALRNDPGNARGPRGRDGRKGERGEDGAAGPRGDLGQDADPSEIVHRLAHNTRFKRSLKGEDGAPGEQGPSGQDGVDGVQGPRGRAGEKGKKGDQGERGEQGDQGLKGDTGLEGSRGPRGEKGENGIPGPPGPAGKDGVNSFALDSKLQKSIEDLQKKPALKIVPGDTNENIQEANIELEGVGVIAAFLEIGYFFKGNNLYIRNHITGKSILIPQDFHFLKVVEDGLDNYKLAFCNYLGNLFFDYKKYNPEYASVLEEYKTIDLRYIKNAANIDLSKYYCHHMHSPLFAVKQGEFEAQSTENRSADVYEIVKDKKIGTLIDEFGFFEHEQFYYVNYHQGYDHHSQELNVTIEDHEGNFQIGDNIIHPIILHDGRLDLLDYLGYQNELM